jgi:uncharacterized protein (UPF0264 family)
MASTNRQLNRKLLVSVFNAQEAREAVLGGARIVDSEDPRSALGNINPRHIMDISDAVLDFSRDLEVQLSTNIGEDQLLFKRSQTGRAIEKSQLEIAGKAAQAAIGVSVSMGTRVHPVNLVKVGVDGMSSEKVLQVLTEVVATLRRTEQCRHAQVMSVLFAQDLKLWAERRSTDSVRNVLVGLREFVPTPEGGDGTFDLTRFAVNTLRNPETDDFLFTDPGQVSLASLIRAGILPEGSDNTDVRLNELFEHSRYFPDIAAHTTRTTQAVIKAMVDTTADAGADAIMLDTSILSKVSNICLIDTASDGLVDINSLVQTNGLQLHGILPLEDLRFFVDYCHYRGIAANVAGSVESFQAQQLWVDIPEVDQISTRGCASAIRRDPSQPSNVGMDTRQWRVIDRALVRGVTAPEHGGVLNIPASLKGNREAADRIAQLIDKLAHKRSRLGMPALETFWVDPFGAQERYQD